AARRVPAPDGPTATAASPAPTPAATGSAHPVAHRRPVAILGAASLRRDDEPSPPRRRADGAGAPGGSIRRGLDRRAQQGGLAARFPVPACRERAPAPASDPPVPRGAPPGRLLAAAARAAPDGSTRAVVERRARGWTALYLADGDASCLCGFIAAA